MEQHLAEARALEDIESEIGELSAHIDAATCRLLLDIAEFDCREGWAKTGFRSCAHWLGWRVGLDLATARERLRVGRALENLPLIRAAFSAGEVSYSKVRAMTRVGTLENEQDLLEVARHGTALHLERLVRLFRNCSSTEERERALRQQQQRYLRAWTDDEGMLCIRGRLPAEVGAMVKQALDAAMRALGQTEAARDANCEEIRSKPAVATPDASAETSEDPSEADEEIDPVCVPPIDEDEAKAEAIAEREVEESVRGTSVPWGPVRRVSPMVELAPEERAQRTADAMGLVAQWALDAIQAGQAGAAGAPGPVEPSGREGAFEVVLHVDAEVLAGDAPVGRCDIEGGPRLAAETMRRLACSAPVVTLMHGKDSEVLGPGRRTRKISAPLWRALRSRDQTCSFPGCTCRKGLVVHHVKHWAHGGETKLSNTTCLCLPHHIALHEGGFRVAGRAPDELHFFAPDGRELPASPPPSSGSGDEMVARNGELGLTVASDTGLTRWQGEPMDYDWAVATLMHRQRRAG